LSECSIFAQTPAHPLVFSSENLSIAFIYLLTFSFFAVNISKITATGSFNDFAFDWMSDAPS
jgi:hypothetical protein